MATRMMNNIYGRRFDTSPFFNWANSAITDDNVVNVSWESEDARSMKYLPFNSTRIVNNSGVDVWFYPNQDLAHGIYIPESTTIVVGGADSVGVRGFAIKRATSTSISADTIQVTCHRTAQTADSVVERLHRKFFNHESPNVI